MNEQAMKIYLQKFKKCPFCGRSHKIIEEDTLTEKLRKRKLSSVRCHIRHGFYRGSYIKNNIVHDVFNCHEYLVKKGIISAKEEVYIITIGGQNEKFEPLENSIDELDEEIEQQFIYDDLDFEETEY